MMVKRKTAQTVLVAIISYWVISIEDGTLLMWYQCGGDSCSDELLLCCFPWLLTFSGAENAGCIFGSLGQRRFCGWMFDDDVGTVAIAMWKNIQLLWCNNVRFDHNDVRFGAAKLWFSMRKTDMWSMFEGSTDLVLYLADTIFISSIQSFDVFDICSVSFISWHLRSELSVSSTWQLWSWQLCRGPTRDFVSDRGGVSPGCIYVTWHGTLPRRQDWVVEKWK